MNKDRRNDILRGSIQPLPLDRTLLVPLVVVMVGSNSVGAQSGGTHVTPRISESFLKGWPINVNVWTLMCLQVDTTAI
jgi:hypothetical protein